MSTTAIIERHYNDVSIQQRAGDQYVDATAMCKSCDKRWHDYARLDNTQAFLAALSAETGIPVSALVETRKGGKPSEQGTFVHPDIAVHLAQWLDPRFAVQVSQWIRELLTTGKVEVVSDTDPLETALMAALETRKRQLALERRTDRIEATATTAERMARTALDQLQSNHGYYTVLAFLKLRGHEVTTGQASAHGRKLTKLCDAKGLEIHTVRDIRYGSVHCYPESVLLEYFGPP